MLKINNDALPNKIEKEIILWQKIHKDTIIQFILRPNNIVRFYRSSDIIATRMAEIDISHYLCSGQLAITATWSSSEDCMYAGIIGCGDLSESKALDYPHIKLKIGSDGQVYRIGDVGVEVSYYATMIDGKKVACSTPKDVFDFQLKKVETLINLCNGADFLTETVLVQQCIVMMTTAFEVYGRDRFIEMSMRDGSLINLDAVYNFISSKYGGKVRDEIESRNKTVGEQVREFISKRHINFQNWKSFKDAYKDAYGIQISDLGMDSDELTKIQSYIKWRHDIIHASNDMAVLNMDQASRQELIFAKKPIAEEGLFLFEKLIRLIHDRTIQRLRQTQ